MVMPMPQEMKDKMRAETAQLARQVQDILGDKSLTPAKQAIEVGKLTGAPNDDMYKFMNDNFRVGPDLAKSIKSLISPHRPVGGPTTKAKIKKRLSI